MSKNNFQYSFEINFINGINQIRGKKAEGIQELITNLEDFKKRDLRILDIKVENNGGY